MTPILRRPERLIVEPRYHLARHLNLQVSFYISKRELALAAPALVSCIPTIAHLRSPRLVRRKSRAAVQTEAQRRLRRCRYGFDRPCP